MKPNLLLLLLVVLLNGEPFSSPAVTPASLTPISAAINRHATVRASFVQTKEMKALNKPVRSEGSLLFVRDRGVIWQIDRPYSETIIAAHDGTVRFRDQNGKETTNRSSTNEQIQGMIQQIMAGNFSALSSRFSFHLERNSTTWQIGLVPTRASAKRGVLRILLTGTAEGFIREVVLVGSEGTTRIAFTVQPNRPITEAEERLLGR